MQTPLRKTALILCLALAGFGCTVGKEVNTTASDFSVTPTGTLEGILLHFNHIPENTYSIFVNFQGIGANGQAAELLNTHIYIWDNDLSKNKLADLKYSGDLQCPFVKRGYEYTITVTVYSIDDFNNNFEMPDPISYSTSAVAGGGIYLVNTPSLNFTDDNRNVVLSEMPVFSKEVVYSPSGLFQFNNYVLMHDGSSCGGGMDYWNELVYPARQMLSSTQEHFGFTGDFPVNAFVYSHLMDSNLEWSVLVAKAPKEVIMSFK